VTQKRGLEQERLQKLLETIFSNKYGCDVKITITKKGATRK
jgi:hypothetical protein